MDNIIGIVVIAILLALYAMSLYSDMQDCNVKAVKAHFEAHRWTSDRGCEVGVNGKWVSYDDAMLARTVKS